VTVIPDSGEPFWSVTVPWKVAVCWPAAGAGVMATMGAAARAVTTRPSRAAAFAFAGFGGDGTGVCAIMGSSLAVLARFGDVAPEESRSRPGQR
jgi:hypothetical protein